MQNNYIHLKINKNFIPYNINHRLYFVVKYTKKPLVGLKSINTPTAT